jgi:uncharacterized sulfatase
METHLPYTPPRTYLESFAPSYFEGGAARDFVRDFNRRAADWFTPPLEPFSELEAEALGQMYDAEVAYQDYLLGRLLEVLDLPEHRDNTMVILVADHGEMLGEHRLMGHAFGVYEELIHVPLLLRLPGQTDGRRVAAPVSATRLFHTTLDAAGVRTYESVSGQRVEPGRLSLSGLNGRGSGSEESVVVSEAYAPTFAVQVMEARKQVLIEELHCRATHRAAYEGKHKLMSIEGAEDRLFSLSADPREMVDLDGRRNAARKRRLREHLVSFLERAGARKPDLEGRRATNVDDAMVQRRLRDLGYLE